MAGQYDKILRENFRTPKAQLLQLLIPASIIRIQPLVPKLQHTILERETDTIAEVVTEDGNHFIVHLEWQSSNDPQMASRMALYDLLLYQTYAKPVMGVVVYVGNDRLRMPALFQFFDFRYRCQLMDVRLLDPETFLRSDDPGEIIFAVLAGKGDQHQKTAIIRRIFSKLQQVLSSDTVHLRTKIRQLEVLSLLRGKDIQKIIIEEEQKMPVIIDIRQDIRYQQGVEEGLEQGITQKAVETARKMFETGLERSLIQRITGLTQEQLEQIAASIPRA